MRQKTHIFLEVINQHKAMIYKIVHAYCKNNSFLQDLYQEIVLQLWSSFDKYDKTYKYSTWIYRIALNTAISYHRKGWTKEKENMEILEHQPLIFTNDEDVHQEKLNLLHQYLRDLKEIDRALTLLFLEGMNHEEISKILGISTSNVGTRLSRIKQALRNKFNSKNK